MPLMKSASLMNVFESLNNAGGARPISQHGFNNEGGFEAGREHVVRAEAYVAGGIDRSCLEY